MAITKIRVFLKSLFFSKIQITHVLEPMWQIIAALYGLTEIAGLDIDGRVKKTGVDIAGLDNDGRIWAIDCNQLKIIIEPFYQLTGTYNSFESVLCLKTYEIHIDKQKP